MDLADLHPEMRAAVLAGQFLQEFAIAEEQVTTGLALLLGLTDGQRELLIQDMPVALKYKALKVLAPELPAELDRTTIKKCADDLLKANSEIRIHLCHRRFGAGQKDLVIIKSGWKNETLAAWSAAEFTHRIHIILATRRPLKEMNDKLSVILTDRLFSEYAAKISRTLAGEWPVRESDRK